MKSSIVLGGFLAVSLVGFVIWSAWSDKREGESVLHPVKDEALEQRLPDMEYRDDRAVGDKVNEVLLDDGEQLMEAILGSFGAVDAIESHELIVLVDASYVPTTAETVTLHYLGEPIEITAGLATNDGTVLRCTLQPSKTSNRTYTLNLCNDHSGSEVVLKVDMWFEDHAQDASYIYPLKFE